MSAAVSQASPVVVQPAFVTGLHWTSIVGPASTPGPASPEGPASEDGPASFEDGPESDVPFPFPPGVLGLAQPKARIAARARVRTQTIFTGAPRPARVVKRGGRIGILPAISRVFCERFERCPRDPHHVVATTRVSLRLHTSQALLRSDCTLCRHRLVAGRPTVPG